MKTLLLGILFSVVSYLVGSLNFGIIYSKTKFKDDIRNHGSGNSGMTNTLRTYGKKSGAIVFVGDFLKGFLAVLVTGLVTHSTVAQAFAAFFVVLGHLYPIYFQFKGGKGVATSGGVILAVAPWMMPILVIVFLLIVKKTKYVSLASLVMCGLYPLLTILGAVVTLNFSTGSIALIIASIIIGLMVMIKHLGNLKRLLAGTERKVGEKSE